MIADWWRATTGRPARSNLTPDCTRLPSIGGFGRGPVRLTGRAHRQEQHTIGDVLRLGDPAERRLPPSDVFDERIVAGHSEVGADLAPNWRVNDAGMHRIYRMPSPRAGEQADPALR
jgi:hypothetical protein